MEPRLEHRQQILRAIRTAANPYIYAQRHADCDINGNTYYDPNYHSDRNTYYYADSNSKPKQHTASYSYTKVSPDAPTAADSSAGPDTGAASAVAPPYSSAAGYSAA